MPKIVGAEARSQLSQSGLHIARHDVVGLMTVSIHSGFDRFRNHFFLGTLFFANFSRIAEQLRVDCSETFLERSLFHKARIRAQWVSDGIGIDLQRVTEFSLRGLTRRRDPFQPSRLAVRNQRAASLRKHRLVINSRQECDPRRRAVGAEDTPSQPSRADVGGYS